jgi:hypothetical protein
MVLGVWSPGTGALVGNIADWVGLAQRVNLNSTTEIDATLTNSSFVSSRTASDGDVLVLEVWRDNIAQSMSTAYSNTIFYDGTTEGSATTNAAYLLFANDVAMSGAAAHIPPHTRQVRQAIQRGASYMKDHSGLWVPERRIWTPGF